MSPQKTHTIDDPRIEIAIGIAAYAAAIWLIYDAYERRNRHRPFAAGILLP